MFEAMFPNGFPQPFCVGKDKSRADVGRVARTSTVFDDDGLVANFTETVERFCRILGEEHVLTEDGFLVDRWFGLDQLPKGLVPLESVFERSGALLGEPGAGKTRALHKQAMDEGAAEGRAIYVDLGQIRNESTFERKTRPLWSLNSDNDKHGVAELPSLFLDGLDECPAGLKVMCGWFEEYLSGSHDVGARVFIGCRSAVYPGLVADTVERVFGRLDRYTLAPLREVDVCTLAAGRAIDGLAFLAEVRRVGAGSLAASPLTLDLLLRIYETRAHRLPARRTDLYAEALPHLAIAQGERRVGGARRGSRGQRTMVAARVCTHMLLTRSAGVVVDDTADEQSGDLRADDLTGGVPEVDSGGEFEVGNELLRSVLDSALFTGRGDGRLGPVHNSYAAYLTAWYLIERQVLVPQLYPLFVQRGELGTPGIHPALQETAAWLIALDPEHGKWLLQADPEALLPYADLVESPDHRSVLVHTALEHERRGVLQAWPRFGGLWPLAHAGLANDLRPALEKLVEPDFDARPDNPDFRAGKLALSLASQVTHGELLPRFVAVAAASHLPAATRTQAIRLAHMSAPDAMAAEFRIRLAEVVAGAVDDPLDELRGVLLDILWPDHLTIHELLEALAPPKNSRHPYAYYGFRAGLARRLREEDLAHVTAWGAASATPASTAAVTGLPARVQSHGLHIQDREVLQRLVDRSLTGPGAATRIPDIARWLLGLLRDDEIDLAVPAPLCVPPSSPTAGRSRELRRALVAELVGLCEEAGDAVRVAYQWSCPRQAEPLGSVVEDLPSDFQDRRGLVDEDDLMWLVGMETERDAASAEVLHPLIRAAWNHENSETWEEVWPLQGTRVWDAVFATYFKPVPINDEAFVARRARRTRRRQEPWPRRDEFVQALNTNLIAAADGDLTCFLRLVENLRTDPNKGVYYLGHDDDLRNRPGTTHLRNDWPDLLEQAAVVYLTQGSPETGDWLGTGAESESAAAGYLALAYLEGRPCGTDGLSADTWRTWAPVIMWFDVSGNGEQAQRKRRLLSDAKKFAQAQLEDTLLTLVSSRDPHDAWQARFLDAMWSERLESELLVRLPTLAGRIPITPPDAADEATANRTRLQTTRVLLERLVTLGNDETRAEVLDLLTTDDTPLRNAQLRIAAILSSLYTDPANTWPAISPLLHDNPSDFDSMVRAAAGHRDPPLEVKLHEGALVEVATLLLKRHPPSADAPLLIDGFTSGDDHIQTWRARVLTALSERGTPVAVRALHSMSMSAPCERVLRSYVVAAENTHRARVWSSPNTRELADLLGDPRKRVVRSGSDLVTLVIEALVGIQGDLTTGFAQSFALWNEYPDAKAPSRPGRPKPSLFRPKREHDLSDYLLHELRLRLAKSEIVIDREVQVDRKPDGSGNRVDLLIQAVPRNTSRGAAALSFFSVVIEVKGNWNRNLYTAMREQLVDDYLHHHRTRHGIYLVGGFPPESWDKDDSNRRQALANDPPNMKTRLDEQASTLNAEHGVDVTPIVLDISFIMPSARNAS